MIYQDVLEGSLKESGVMTEQDLDQTNSQKPDGVSISSLGSLTFKTSLPFEPEIEENKVGEAAIYEDLFAAGGENNEKLDKMINFLQMKTIGEKQLRKVCEKFKKAKLMIVGSKVQFLEQGQSQEEWLGTNSKHYELQIYWRESEREDKRKKYAILKMRGEPKPWELKEVQKQAAQNLAREVLKELVLPKKI